MDDILFTLCKHDVDIIDGWHPCPSSLISKLLNINIGKVKYHLRKLKKQGLVNSCHEGGQDEDGYVWCRWGWHVTEKAHRTEEYVKAFEAEKVICKECFDIDIS